MARRTRLSLCLLLIAALALTLVACGDDSDSTTDSSTAAADAKPAEAPTDWPATTVDLGEGKEVSYPKGKKPRFVFFSFGADVYVDAIEKGAQDEADRLGIEMDVLDARVDPVRQVQQMKDAMQSGKYDGGFVTPVANSLLCDLGTKQMPAKNMMLVVTNSAICDRAAKDGEEAWAPGSLAFVGGTQFQSTFKEWGEQIRKENPGPQKVIVLAGPKGNSQSDNVVKAFQDISKEHPEFEIVAAVNTTFQTADALSKMQDALQANPDTTIVATIFSVLTKATGVALRQAGKTGDVKLYDVGADQTVLPMIDSGEVTMTYPYYPQTIGRTAMSALYKARMGEPFERVYENDGHEPEDLRKPGDPLLFVNKDNLQAWKDSGLIEY